MRVSPRSLPPTTDPSSFPKLFRSILVAAIAAEGCTEPVKAAPDATPAGPPFENACPAEENYYSVSNRIDELRAAAGLDSLEVRSVDRRNNWDGGLGPPVPWMTGAAAGVRCATATSASACEAAFAALENDSPPGSVAVGWVLVYTRGDEAGVARNIDDMARLFAPIDTAGEAAFIASVRHGLRVACVSSARRSASGGWEVIGDALSDCSSRSGQRQTVTRTLVSVAPDGASTATPLETGDSDYWCPVPGRRPDGLRDAPSDAGDDVGRWLARAAHMEAASVFAFESLARELAQLGAPATLVEAARRSADDERRHARMMGRLAERAGAAVPPVAVETSHARTAFAIALENAVEGCVHETWAAMETLAQSARAARPGVAATMGAIADDEMRHASLAWKVAAWIEPRLPEAERFAVCEAREGARAALEARVSRGYDSGMGEALGLPSPGLAARLVASLHAALA